MVLEILGIIAVAVASYFAGKYGLLDVQIKRFIAWLYSKTLPKPVAPETTQADAKEETYEKVSPTLYTKAAKK